MYDGPTHFKNDCIRMLTKRINKPHHFTMPYTTWSNGGVERFGKELITVMWPMNGEPRWDFREWADLIRLAQIVINSLPSMERLSIWALTAFTGIHARPPIKTTYLEARPENLWTFQHHRTSNSKTPHPYWRLATK